MQTAAIRTRRDGWTPARRADILGALRVSGRPADACAWVGMSLTGAYALARRDPVFADGWSAALGAHGSDRRRAPAPPPGELTDSELMRRLGTAQAALDGRPRGIVAQQKSRWA